MLEWVWWAKHLIQKYNDVPAVNPTHTASQMLTQNKVFPLHCHTLATMVVWLERDEGKGSMDDRCPPSFLTKAVKWGGMIEG